MVLARYPRAGTIWKATNYHVGGKRRRVRGDDKSTYKGVRVFLDPKKVELWQEIKAWYFKLKTKKEQTLEGINKEIKEAGTTILTVQKVELRPEAVEKKHKGKIGVCPTCREAYPLNDGATCLLCQGNTLYTQESRI